MLAPRLGAAQVPGRLPARPDLADARRADGGDLPEPVRRPAAAQRRHRRREPRAARLRRLPGQGRALRPLRRVPRRRAPALDRARPSTSRASTCTSRGRSSSTLPHPVPPIYFGGSSPAAGTVAAQHADVYLTWGEPPGAVAEKIAWIRDLAAAEGRESASASACTSSPATPPTRPGPRPSGCSTGIDDETDRARCRPGSPGASPRASGGCWSCTGAAATTSRSTPTCGPASAWCAAAPAPRWWAATRRSPTGSQEYADARHRRVRALGLPAPRGGLLVRRGRAAGPRASAVCGRNPPPACGPSPRVPFARSGPGGLVMRAASRSWSATRSRARARSPPRSTSPGSSPVRARAGRRPRRPRRRRCSTGPTRPSTGLSGGCGAADLVVVASPTYKATYTGLLKVFLDRFPAGAACATWSRCR